MSATEETVSMKLFLSEVTTMPSRAVRTPTRVLPKVPLGGPGEIE